MIWKVKDLIAVLSDHDQDAQVMVGTAYDNDTELTSAFDVYSEGVNNIEGNFYMSVGDDNPEKTVVALW